MVLASAPADAFQFLRLKAVGVAFTGLCLDVEWLLDLFYLEDFSPINFHLFHRYVIRNTAYLSVTCYVT